MAQFVCPFTWLETQCWFQNCEALRCNLSILAEARIFTHGSPDTTDTSDTFARSPQFKWHKHGLCDGWLTPIVVQIQPNRNIAASQFPTIRHPTFHILHQSCNTHVFIFTKSILADQVVYVQLHSVDMEEFNSIFLELWDLLDTTYIKVWQIVK